MSVVQGSVQFCVVMFNPEHVPWHCAGRMWEELQSYKIWADRIIPDLSFAPENDEKLRVQLQLKVLPYYCIRGVFQK